MVLVFEVVELVARDRSVGVRKSVVADIRRLRAPAGPLTTLRHNFQPGTFSPTLEVKGGRYTVTITAATATNDKNPIIGPASYYFGARRSYTVVAHLDASGAPTATKYRNPLSRPSSGRGRLIVRHDAAAPAVASTARAAALRSSTACM